jgi:hypothetical protein
VNVVKVELTYEDADYQRAIRFMSRDQYRIGFAVLAIGGLVLGTFLYRAGLSEDFAWWVIPGLFVLVALFYGLSALSQRWTIRRQLAKIPDSRGPYVWTIDTEGIQISGALSSSTIKWAALTKVRETKLDFFFYQGPKIARFLPKRVISDSQQQSDLRRLIAECMPGKAKLFSA